MLENRKYYIIMTIDMKRGESMKWWVPRSSPARKLKMTEDDSEVEFDYINTEWERAKHRKFSGIGGIELVRYIVDEYTLITNKHMEGMSLSEMGLTPNINFYDEMCDPNVIVAMSITPLPKDEEIGNGYMWDSIKNAIMDEFDPNH